MIAFQLNIFFADLKIGKIFMNIIIEKIFKIAIFGLICKINIVIF